MSYLVSQNLQILTIRRISRMNDNDVEDTILKGKYHRQQCVDEKCLADMASRVIDVLWDCVNRSVTLSMLCHKPFKVLWQDADSTGWRDSGLLHAESSQNNRATSDPSPALQQDCTSPTPPPTTNFSALPIPTHTDQNPRPNGAADQIHCSQAQVPSLGLEGLLDLGRNPESGDFRTGVVEGPSQEASQMYDFHMGTAEDQLHDSYLTWNFHAGMVEDPLQGACQTAPCQTWDFHMGTVEDPLYDSYQTWNSHTGVAELLCSGENEASQIDGCQTSPNVVSGTQSFQVYLDPSRQTIVRHHPSRESQPDDTVLDSHLYNDMILMPQRATPSQCRFTGCDLSIPSTLRQDLSSETRDFSENNNRSIATPVIFT